MIIEGRAYVRGGLQDSCIRIEDGRIAEIKRTLAGERVRLRGIILPAGIDLHVHFREPGMTHKEDFFTGTSSAACGGVSCVFDMPNTDPPTTTPARVAEKIAEAERKAVVDFGIFAGLTESGDTEGLAGAATAFKAYLAPSSGDLAVDFGALLAHKEDLKGAKKFITVHCEDPNYFLDIPVTRLEAHLASRPDGAEVSGIELARQLQGVPRVHIAHMSSERGLAALAGSGLTSEVTPHHLFLDVNCGLGTLAKVNPPLRHRHDKNALWAAFATGTIDVVASDHAPHTRDEKEQDFATAPPGVPGVETMLPLLLERVGQKRLPLERLVTAACERPAELLNMRKGRIEVGYDADLIAVNLRDARRIRADDLHSRCGWTPFEGMKGVFPTATYLRGELVVENGEVVSKRTGRYVGANH